MPRVFSTISRHSRREMRPRADRVELNDLFALFPPLPRFRHRPLAVQRRLVQEKVEQMQHRVRANVARHRLAAARINAAWLAKRRG